MESKMFSDDGKQVYCPICNSFFPASPYLSTIFEEANKKWLANMVTHYRHTHITSWNKCWGYGGNRYKQGWFGDYDEEKSIVNERAKRQIIRKCKEFLRANRFSRTDLIALEGTTDETLKLFDKFFS